LYFGLCRIGFGLGHVLGLEQNWTKEQLGLKLAQQEGERISRRSRSFLLKAWSPSFSYAPRSKFLVTCLGGKSHLPHDEGLTPTKDEGTCLRRLSMFRKEVH